MEHLKKCKVVILYCTHTSAIWHKHVSYGRSMSTVCNWVVYTTYATEDCQPMQLSCVHMYQLPIYVHAYIHWWWWLILCIPITISKMHSKPSSETKWCQSKLLTVTEINQENIIREDHTKLSMLTWNIHCRWMHSISEQIHTIIKEEKFVGTSQLKASMLSV